MHHYLQLCLHRNFLACITFLQGKDREVRIRVNNIIQKLTKTLITFYTIRGNSQYFGFACNIIMITIMIMIMTVMDIYNESVCFYLIHTFMRTCINLLKCVIHSKNVPFYIQALVK